MCKSGTMCWSVIYPALQELWLHTGISRTLYEAMFGMKPKNGLLSSILPHSFVKYTSTEEELEEQLLLMKK